jgi:hypothetical protein
MTGVGGRRKNDKCRVFPLSLPLQTVAVDAASPRHPKFPLLVEILSKGPIGQTSFSGGARLSRRRRPQDQNACARRGW